MTWLVVASEQDVAAHWAADRLRASGLSPLAVVTDTDLAGATWRHEASDDGFRTHLNLADGREIDSAMVRGTLNRLTYVPSALVAGLAQDDRAYALQELTALALSWLASLPGPLLNPPDPRGLCGAWRSPAEWVLLATEAGLRPLPVSADHEPPNTKGSWQYWPPFAPILEDVVVVDTAVLAGADLDPTTVGACRCLAQMAATPVLGLAFDGDRVAGVTPLPDLRAGGNDLIEALTSALNAP